MRQAQLSTVVLVSFLAVERQKLETRLLRTDISHEVHERSREFRQAATRPSGASRADEVELGVFVAGFGGPEATINSAFDEQEPLNFS